MPHRRRLYLLVFGLFVFMGFGFFGVPFRSDAAPPAGHQPRQWIPWQPIREPGYRMATSHPAPWVGPTLREPFRAWVVFVNGEYTPGYWSGTAAPRNEPWPYLLNPSGLDRPSGSFTESTAATAIATHVGQELQVYAEKSYSIPPEKEALRTGVPALPIRKKAREMVSLRVMAGGSSNHSPIPAFVGTPYPNNLLPRVDRALVRETLGDDFYPPAAAGENPLWGSPVWKLNDSPVNLSEISQMETPADQPAYRFIRLRKGDAAPYRNANNQRLELILPLSDLNELPPLRLDDETYAIDPVSGEEYVPQNRFLYLQYRFRSLPAPGKGADERSVSAASIRNRPGALVFCGGDDQINQVAAGRDRFLAWEQRAGGVLSDSILTQKPEFPLDWPIYQQAYGKVVVGAIPVASPVFARSPWKGV